MGTVNINGVSRKMTAEEQDAYDAQQVDWNSKSAERKLAEIKKNKKSKTSRNRLPCFIRCSFI